MKTSYPELFPGEVRYGTGTPEVILFDLWRTLARGPYPEPIKNLQEFLGLDGVVSDEAFLVVCLTTPAEDPEVYIRTIADRFDVPVPAEARQKFLNLVETEINGLCLYTDVINELKALKEKGFKLGLVTNSWPFPVDILLRQSGLDTVFDVVVSSHEAQIAKQQGPEIYSLAARRINVPVSRCLMVGDNPRLDVFPAQAAGMQTVLIDRHADYIGEDGRPKDGQLAAANLRIVRNLQQLREIVTAARG